MVIRQPVGGPRVITSHVFQPGGKHEPWCHFVVGERMVQSSAVVPKLCSRDGEDHAMQPLGMRHAEWCPLSEQPLPDVPHDLHRAVQKCACGDQLCQAIYDLGLADAAAERVAIERDNVDLHKALAEAIKRILPRDNTPRRGFRTDDLLAVLDRTTRPPEPEPAPELEPEPRCTIAGCIGEPTWMLVQVRQVQHSAELFCAQHHSRYAGMPGHWRSWSKQERIKQSASRP